MAPQTNGAFKVFFIPEPQRTTYGLEIVSKEDLFSTHTGYLDSYPCLQ